jgi:hypothetical protein
MTIADGAPLAPRNPIAPGTFVVKIAFSLSS